MSSIDAVSYQTLIPGKGDVEDKVVDVLYISKYMLNLRSSGEVNYTYTETGVYKNGKPKRTVHLNKGKVDALRRALIENTNGEEYQERVKSAVQSVFSSIED